MVQRSLREPSADALGHPTADVQTGGTELRAAHPAAIPLHGPDTLAGLLALADSTQGRRHHLEPASLQFVAALLVDPSSDDGVGPAGSYRATAREGSSA